MYRIDKDEVVRLGAQQVITREVEAPERNARPRMGFDVAMQELTPGRLAVFLWGGSLRRF